MSVWNNVFFPLDYVSSTASRIKKKMTTTSTNSTATIKLARNLWRTATTYSLWPQEEQAIVEWSERKDVPTRSSVLTDMERLQGKTTALILWVLAELMLGTTTDVRWFVRGKSARKVQKQIMFILTMNHIKPTIDAANLYWDDHKELGVRRGHIRFLAQGFFGSSSGKEAALKTTTVDSTVIWILDDYDLFRVVPKSIPPQTLIVGTWTPEFGC